ncbi:MAG TPA: family 43 glycosylhydrolase [Anaerohalosphaeraceae bacterium]|nr:family 43 glycosylhydrolase [Anaerohalosphaeraceae bacterium]HPP56686.1 family 43 glycosylhydrolase [Anaerohalosphaeraceae bacterium]
MKGFGRLWVLAVLAAVFSNAQSKTEAGEEKIASKPLYRDPVYDGAADPVLVWHPDEKKWLMFYTNRRANAADAEGVSWVHGTPIGIAESADGGATWTYRGKANIRYKKGDDTYWAPEIVEHEGTWHMYLTYVPGIFRDWNHPRQILHLTSRNLIDWEYQSTLSLSSDRVIDACVYRLPDGTWRMWYNNERDGKSIYYADSRDLYQWEDKGRVPGQWRGEGPKVFWWRGFYWMLVDVWDGLGVYRSSDALNWERQKDNLLREPGTGADDQVKGGHPDVVVSGDRAFVFYFTHPGRRGEDARKDGFEQRRSSIQVAELFEKDGWLFCDRNRPVRIDLKGTSVGRRDMQAVYEQVRTPYKYGVVIEPHAGKMVDGPTVFRHQGRWYMIYFQMEDKPAGYTTHLAVSDDLVHWSPQGVILPHGQEGAWDWAQAAGGIALYDYRWGGNYGLHTHDGKYWLSYLGGEKEGYETPPLSIGLAWTDDPTAAKPWQRLAGPVLRPSDPDARLFERRTLFKSHIIYDPQQTVGAPYVMFYNAAAREGGERIGMAVSHDMVQWKRFGPGPVVENRSPAGKAGISGDPQIAKIGDLWVMFYFGAFWRPGAFDTFACSYDLVHWTKWDGPDLIVSSEPWDETYAHKPWVVYWNGIVYHFYCAVGQKGRAIALAASKDLKETAEP